MTFFLKKYVLDKNAISWADLPWKLRLVMPLIETLLNSMGKYISNTCEYKIEQRQLFYEYN